MDILPRIILNLSRWKLIVLAFFAGAASVLALAPFHAWPVLFVTFPVMIWLLDAVRLQYDDGFDPLQRVRKLLLMAFLVGWAFGFGYFLFGIYWVGYSFLANANSSVIAMPFAVIGLTAGLGLFYAVAAVISVVMWRRGYARIAGFVFAFFLAEIARGHVLTGFPWNLFGQALAASDASMQAAAYIGIYGLTLAALFVSAAPAAYLSAPEARKARLAFPIIAALIILAAGHVLGERRLAQASDALEDSQIRIVQPNIPQLEKWKPENRGWIFMRLLDLSRSGVTGSADISEFSHVVWPESTVPFLFVFNNEILNPEAKELLSGLIPSQTLLLVGAERAEGEKISGDRLSVYRVFNSLFIVEQQAKIRDIYDKFHLVPFGEYIPFSQTLETFGFRALSHQLSGFAAGAGGKKLYSASLSPPFTPLICYEIIFPGNVVNGNLRPKWLVNVTNDAWFGDSTGPYQHLHQARIRALEEGLPVMRAANTGISAVIDGYGRIRSKLGLGITGVIDHKLPVSLPVTFYAKTRKPAFIILFLFPLVIYLAIFVLPNRN